MIRQYVDFDTFCDATRQTRAAVTHAKALTARELLTCRAKGQGITGPGRLLFETESAIAWITRAWRDVDESMVARIRAGSHPKTHWDSLAPLSASA